MNWRLGRVGDNTTTTARTRCFVLSFADTGNGTSKIHLGIESHASPTRTSVAFYSCRWPLRPYFLSHSNFALVTTPPRPPRFVYKNHRFNPSIHSLSFYKPPGHIFPTHSASFPCTEKERESIEINMAPLCECMKCI